MYAKYFYIKKDFSDLIQFFLFFQILNFKSKLKN